MTMRERNTAREIPRIIHVVNLIALLLGSLILLLSAVDQTYQLVLLVPLILVLLAVYWRRRKDSRLVTGYFGMALALLGWILICEHIVLIDNALGTQISSRISLGTRLMAYVDATLRTPWRLYLAPCCGDPLSWHFQPGSLYRHVFDCPTCNAPYEIIVDETGYLNREPGLMLSQPQIDLFWAGDSVLQGFGAPSVVEALRQRLPGSMWNLSIEGYGPRQKVNALLTYALPKQPRWLILEFYSGNDLQEGIRDALCEGMGDFRCRNDMPEVRRRAARHPLYRAIFNPPSNLWTRAADLTTENLTLATTRYLIVALKSHLKAGLTALSGSSAEPPAAEYPFDSTPRGGMSIPPTAVHDGQWQAYLNAGMAVAEKHYARLKAQLVGIVPRPTVILLYNPVPYELYREPADLQPVAEQTSAFQRERLRAFAQAHGWQFLDLTEPLRRAVRARQLWIFGRVDRTHWSPEGTALVADVLATELRPFLAR